MSLHFCDCPHCDNQGGDEKDGCTCAHLALDAERENVRRLRERVGAALLDLHDARQLGPAVDPLGDAVDAALERIRAALAETEDKP